MGWTEHTDCDKHIKELETGLDSLRSRLELYEESIRYLRLDLEAERNLVSVLREKETHLLEAEKKIVAFEEERSGFEFLAKTAESKLLAAEKKIEKIKWQGCCGDNIAEIPVGCRAPFVWGEKIYRCIDCEVLFHKHCLRKHCSDDLLAEQLKTERMKTVLGEAGSVLGLIADRDPQFMETMKKCDAFLAPSDDSKEAGLILAVVEAAKKHVWARQHIVGYKELWDAVAALDAARKENHGK